MTSLTSSSSTLRLRELLGDREYLLHLGDDGNERYSCFVSVRDVPAYMIPRDILNYFGGSLHEIKAFHIYQHVEDAETYAAIIEMTSRETANALISDYSGQQLSSLEGTICDVAKVMGAEIWEDGGNGKGYKEEQQAADDRSGRMFLQEWYEGVHAYTCPLCLDPIISTHSASPSPSPTPTPFRASPRVSPRVSPLTLPGRHMASSSSSSSLVSSASSSSQPRGYFSTCCRHHFHIDCVLKLQEPQCPVCRFQHDSTSSMVSQCSTCGWRGRQYNQNQSMPFSSASAPFTSLSAGTGAVPPSSGNDSDLWMCMVCGYVGCGRSNNFHIFSHYKETMHAYVLNLDSKRVWDFAGGGYVHRLVISSPAEEAPPFALPFAVAGARGEETGTTEGAGIGEEWQQVQPANRRARRAASRAHQEQQEEEEQMRKEQHLIADGVGSHAFSVSSSRDHLAFGADDGDDGDDGHGPGAPDVGIMRPHARAPTKMVEISGTGGDSDGYGGLGYGSTGTGERPTHVSALGLSNRQEEELVHAHLETAAEEFGDVLLQKMRRRRQNFEEQVRNIYRRVNFTTGAGAGADGGGTGMTSESIMVSSSGDNKRGQERNKSKEDGDSINHTNLNTNAKTSGSSSSSGGGGGGKARRGYSKKAASASAEAWSTALLRPLVEERKKGDNKIKRAKEKLRECEEELDVITRLNEVLLASEEEWLAKIAVAERAKETAAQENERMKDLLEGQISVLMDRMNKMEAAESDAPTGDALQEEHEYQQGQQGRSTGTGRSTGRRGG